MLDSGIVRTANVSGKVEMRRSAAYHSESTHLSSKLCPTLAAKATTHSQLTAAMCTEGHWFPSPCPRWAGNSSGFLDLPNRQHYG